jgi:hypothetical protein
MDKRDKGVRCTQSMNQYESDCDRIPTCGEGGGEGVEKMTY